MLHSIVYGVDLRRPAMDALCVFLTRNSIMRFRFDVSVVSQNLQSPQGTLLSRASEFRNSAS